MRVDKFLKLSRIIKRRSVAKDFCDAGKVRINDREAKAGDQVKLGDILQVAFGSKIFCYRVLSLQDKTTKEAAATMIEEL